MVHRIAPARFEDIEKTDDVALDVDIRVFQRIPHSRLRCQVDGDVRSVIRERFQQAFFIRQIRFNEGKAGIRLQ